MPPLPNRRLILGAPFLALAQSKVTEIRIKEVRAEYEDFLYRTPYKFGNQVVDRVTLLNVRTRVEGSNGKSAEGFGSMSLGVNWAFPSKALTYSETLDAVKAHAAKIRAITAGHTELGHPVEINHVLEPAYLKAAGEVERERKLPIPIPKLCTLLAASPFDASIHDAYGRLLGRSAYETYGPDCLRHTLDRYLGAAFRGEHLQRYVQRKPTPKIALFHSVGAGDPIEAEDIQKRIGDGLPETLPEWIRYNGLTHIKIKLTGDDLKWDADRVVRIDRAAARTQAERGVRELQYCLDFNERCPNAKALLGFIQEVKSRAPDAFGRILYLEQPTARDLKANPQNTMHEAAKLRPVVIDESLVDYESLLAARDLGYTGVALKACKGQSAAMLMAAAAQKHKMFLCVQDLTCPGASFIHSAGLAAHVPGVSGIEGNSRQYVPSANAPWTKRYPGLFVIKDGRLATSTLAGNGLSFDA